MKQNVSKVFDHMTRGSCIPINFVKSGDDYSSPVYNIRTGTYIDSDRPIRHTWLVKVLICRVGNIRVKRGRCEEWITICIRIIIIVIHITNI